MSNSFTAAITRSTLPCNRLPEVIRPLSLMQRKILLTICRCQSIPYPGSKLLKQLVRGYPNIYDRSIVTSSGDWISLMSIIDSLHDFIVDPIQNGFVQMLIKTIECTDDDVIDAIRSGYDKEIVASQERRFRPHLHLPTIFSHLFSDRSLPLFEGLVTANMEVHDYIRSRLHTCRRSLSSKPYYPRYGTKLISRGSTAHYQQMLDIHGLCFPSTTTGLECLYSRTGESVDGNSEIKDAFKYHDLRPRIYFCRGATHYNHSRYIQEIFGRIIEGFQSIHKFERFHITHLEMRDEEIFIVYDFTTFTTNLQSLSEFIHGLAEFYRDVTITIVDTYQGMVDISLCEYLHSYASHCNDSPKFDWFENQDPFCEPHTFTSGAGLLGVPGNITSSTLWHAIVLMCIIGSIVCKVVGDDAGVVLGAGIEVPDFIAMLNKVGDVSLPKTEHWEFQDPSSSDIDLEIWNYVKRQIYRLENSIHTGPDPMNFPNPSLFIRGFGDRFHSISNIEYEPIRRVQCADRFVRECQRFRISERGPDQQDICHWYHRFIIAPVYAENRVKELKGQQPLRFHKSVTDLGFEEWYRGLESDFVTLPDFLDVPDYPEMWFTMKEYKVCSNPAIKLLVALEYGVVKKRVITVPVSDYELLYTYYNTSYRASYDFVIFESCPSHLIDLLPISVSYSHDDSDISQVYGLEDELEDLYI